MKPRIVVILSHKPNFAGEAAAITDYFAEQGKGIQVVWQGTKRATDFWALFDKLPSYYLANVGVAVLDRSGVPIRAEMARNGKMEKSQMEDMLLLFLRSEDDGRCEERLEVQKPLTPGPWREDEDLLPPRGRAFSLEERDNS